MSAVRSFHGKLLLFGEYTVVLGAQALVVPYTKVSGHWTFADQMNDKNKAASSNYMLQKYCEWLGKGQHAQSIDVERFKFEIATGLAFDSNIPNGYGLGSSGALVAALFDRYRLIPVPGQLTALRSLLGSLENYFHGNSSGLDPLACYVGKPLMLDDGEIEILAQCPVPEGIKLSLHDTGLTAPTGPLVDYFREQMKTFSFFNKIKRQLIPATARAIKAWTTGNAIQLWEALHDISAFQLALFQPMIPESIRPIWQQGLDTGSHCMKLCGSGGGGYVMLFEHIS